MKQNITTFKTCLLLAGSLALAASCQDYEPFSEQQVQDRAYTREFERKFGEIDPNQNWDLFGQLSRGIASVPDGNYGITRATIDPNTGMQTENGITFGWRKNNGVQETISLTDALKTTYKTVLPESQTEVQPYGQTNLGQVTQNFTTTARTFRIAPVLSETAGRNEIGIYWHTDGSAGSEVIRDKDGNFAFIRFQTLLSADEYKSHMSANSADVFEVHVPNTIPSYGFYITNYNYENRPVLKTKYSESRLNQIIPGFYDNNGELVEPSYVATFNLKDLGLSDTDDQQYLCFEDWMAKADGEELARNFDMNDVVFGIFIDPSSIVDHDAVNEEAILACEDLNNFDFDFNDVALGLRYKEEYDYYFDANNKKQIKEDSRRRTLSITAMAAGGAYESTIAFNTTPEITFGKIHTLMGENPVIESATGHNPKNPKFNATKDYMGDGLVYVFEERMTDAGGYETTVQMGSGEPTTYQDRIIPVKNLESATYPTFLSQLFAENFFKVYCTQGKTDGKVEARLLSNKTQTQADTYYDNETNTSFSKAPQMMLLPWYFEWPQENEWIQDAYSGFSAWVQDAAQTNWILTSQDDNLIVERGDFSASSEEVIPVTPDLVTHTVENLPVENYKTNVYDAVTTYNNGVFISVDDIVIADGATAVLKVTYNYKTEVPMYLNDANNQQLYKDSSPDHNGYSWQWMKNQQYDLNLAIANGQYTPITINYPLTNEMLQRVINTGGIWLLAQGDILLNVKEADLEITGWIDPSTVHDLSVTPTSMVFNTTATQTITVTSSASNITYSSSDTNVATVSADGVVTPGVNGTATITVTAEAEGSLGARKKTVSVTVDYAHQIQLTKDSETLTSLAFNSTEAQTFTATSSTGGVLSVASSDDNVIRVSINGSTVTVTPVADGEATITVTASGGDLSEHSVSIPVSVKIIPNGYDASDECTYNGGGVFPVSDAVVSSILTAGKAKVAVGVSSQPVGTTFTVQLAYNQTKTFTIEDGKSIYEVEFDNVNPLQWNKLFVVTPNQNVNFTSGWIKAVTN